MEAKCYLASGPDVDRTMMQLITLARDNGSTSLSALYNDMAGISLSKNRSTLVLVGGRDSIHNLLFWSGTTFSILGTCPWYVSFARKHKVFGKNETCLKIVCGPGHHQPEDGSEFVPLGVKGTGMQMRLTPTELAHLLNRLYGWG